MNLQNLNNIKEKEIKYKLADNWLPKLKELIDEKLRLYSIEFPVKTLDGIKYADLLFEIDKNDSPFKNNMLVLELKKELIGTGVVDQVSRYTHFIKLQLHRKNKVTSIIAGPYFSDWELKKCKDNNILALQYDLKGNMRFLNV